MSLSAPDQSSRATQAPQQESWTIQRILYWSTDFLRERGSESPRLDAELLIAHALGCTRIQLYTSYDKPLTAEEREPIKQALKRRAAGEPVAYITGTKEFMGLVFDVSPAVLIPRPDTEVLVETAQAEAKKRGGPVKILDVGTGSGCIAIALAKRVKDSVVTAWDVSDEALAMARGNSTRLALPVSFAKVDALSETAWTGGGEAFDMIVTNPPYISPAEKASLKPSVAKYEPESALYADDDGLAFYRTFAAHAGERLAPDGVLLAEIGYAQGGAVSALFVDAGWRDVVVLKDYNKQDRVVVARR